MTTPIPPTSRRELLHTGLAAGALGLLPAVPLAAEPPSSAPASGPAGDAPLPTRKLGRSGVQVSVLNLGTAFELSQEILDHAYMRGVRYFDTADCYPDPEHIGGSEGAIANWFDRTGKRKEIFLVTKCHPRGGPAELPRLLDERLKALRADYVDLILIHALKYSEYGNASADWLRGGEFKSVADRIRKSGKARLVGFSSHDTEKSTYLTAAAEGGFVDACMVKYDPRSKDNDEMNKALDAAHKAGLGVIAMKTQSSADQFAPRWKKFHKGGLSAYQAVVKAVLADDRLTGMTSHMDTKTVINQNTAAARDPQKLSHADAALLRDMYAAGPHRLCERCGGACEAAIDGRAPLHDVARMVMYYERYRNGRITRACARQLSPGWEFAAESDLRTASLACADGLDYVSIFDRARRYFVRASTHSQSAAEVG